MPSYTAETLVAKVKRWGSIPTTQALFQTADFISLMDDSLKYDLTPIIMSAKEEYFMRSKTVAITSTISEYIIPTRAIGGGLREVKIQIGTGANTSTKVLRRIDPGHSEQYRDGYYVKGNRIVLTDPAAYSGGSIIYEFPCRPNSLVADIDAARITNITGLDVTVSSYPSAWLQSDKFDLIQNNAPFDWLSIDNDVVIVSNVFTFSTIPDYLEVGDWLCLAGESPVPQIPLEAIEVMCQSVVLKCLDALGDDSGSTIAKGRLDSMTKNLLNILEPRVSDQPQKIVNMTSLSFDNYPRYSNY